MQQSRHPVQGFFSGVGELTWFDVLLDFIFKLTAMSSELLLAVGVILSTANHFQHGGLFDNNSPIFQAWTWTQAVGFEASAGVVLGRSLDANREGDKVKRNILLILMGSLAFVGTVMLVMAFVELSTGITENSLPTWYGVAMAILRGVVSVAYVTIGRVKNRRFSGAEIVPSASVPDVFARLTGIGESVQQVGANSDLRFQQLERKTEDRLLHIEAKMNERIFALATTLDGFATHVYGISESFKAIEANIQEQLSPIAGTLDAHGQSLSLLPSLMAQLEQIETASQYQLRTVTEEVTRVKVTLEQHGQALPILADRITENRIPTTHRLESVNSRKKVQVKASVKGSVDADFDKKSFVYQCLSEDETMTIGAIQQKALEVKQTISPGYISEQRKLYRTQNSISSTNEIALPDEGEHLLETTLIGVEQ